MSQFNKRVVSLWLLLAMVFTQLAVSAYACPMMAAAVRAEATAAAANDSPCCDHQDLAQPGLCQKHCQNGQQNVNDSPVPLPPLAGAPAFAVAVPVYQVASFATTSLFPPLLRATSPPLSIRNCCLRI